MPHEMSVSRVHCGHCGGIVRPMRHSFQCGIEDEIARTTDRLLRLGQDILAASTVRATT